jgi:small subunit ribosomal protein S16
LLSIRLKRMGRTHRPYYRLVVSDSRNRPGGQNVDEVGQYDPLPNPAEIRLNLERVDYWLQRGAKPSRQVANLIAISRKNAQGNA